MIKNVPASPGGPNKTKQVNSRDRPDHYHKFIHGLNEYQ